MFAFLKNPTCHLSFALVMGLQKDTESIFKHLHREFSLKILFEVNVQTVGGLPTTKKKCLAWTRWTAG